MLIMVLLCSAQAYAQETAQSIMDKSYAAIKGKKSVTYDVNYRVRHLRDNDTLTYKSRVYMLRDTKDTVFGGCFWFTISDSLVKFYDLNHIFFLKQKTRRAIIYDPHKKGQLSVIRGSDQSDCLWYAFLSPDKMRKLTLPPNGVKKLTDTVIHKNNCYRVLISLPDDGEATDMNLTMYIDKRTYIPILQTRIVKFQGNTQYTEFYLEHYSFNNVTASRFSEKQIPDNYNQSTFDKPAKRKDIVGLPAPLLGGKNYQDNMRDDTINFKGKITVLDFWYMTCLGCIKAIPSIEKLRTRYDTSLVQIYGVNCYDNDTQNIKKLPTFLKFNEIRYPILLTDKKVVTDYSFNAFPTFFIIDRQGKVVFSQDGYWNALYQQIDSVITSISK